MNIGLLFNKVAFRDLDDKGKFSTQVQKVSQDLGTVQLDTCLTEPLDARSQGLANTSWKKLELIQLVTEWPGLAMGLGYSHSTGKSDEEFKMGFYFDFTTGLPVLEGHAVKGRLRSFFPGRYTSKKKQKAVEVRMISILKELNIFPANGDVPTSDESWSGFIQGLEGIIFEGKAQGGTVAPLLQDTFLVAFPSAGAEKGKVVKQYELVERKGIFLAEDTITPHKHPLKDPIPLRFLKILPGVTFTFQFYLNDLGIHSSDKKKLFEYLLIRFGAGAKSETGYGKFSKPGKPVDDNTNKNDFDWHISFFDTPDQKVDNQDENRSISSPKSTANKREPLQEADDWLEPEDIKIGNLIPATVVDSNSGNSKVRIHVKKFPIEQSVHGNKAVKTVGNVKVVRIEGNLAKGKFNLFIDPKTFD